MHFNYIDTCVVSQKISDFFRKCYWCIFICCGTSLYSRFVHTCKYWRFVRVFRPWWGTFMYVPSGYTPGIKLIKLNEMTRRSASHFYSKRFLSFVACSVLYEFNVVSFIITAVIVIVWSLFHSDLLAVLFSSPRMSDYITNLNFNILLNYLCLSTSFNLQCSVVSCMLYFLVVTI